MSENSLDKLLQFMNYLSTKGLMNKNTVAARKAAVNAFLGILSPEEAQNVTNLDLDEVAIRFQNLKRTDFTPESLKVYESRARNAIDDFKNFLQNPATFKPQVAAPRTQIIGKPDKENNRHAPRGGAAFFDHEVVFPVPIRPDVVVKITGIPSDLTKQEAAKIANVVNALATVE
jgi:hypothetical protein